MKITFKVAMHLSNLAHKFLTTMHLR